MTHSGADERRTRVVLAASGADLLTNLQQLSAAGGTRVFPYMQPDPTESSVRALLATLGYEKDSVDAILATCGTRLRLLSPFLKSRVDDVENQLQLLQEHAKSVIIELMSRCDGKEGQKELAKVLDMLAETPTSSTSVRAFPTWAVKPFPNRVLLQKIGGTAAFQNLAVRQAWLRVRGEYV
jgi:hypothetical protein